MLKCIICTLLAACLSLASFAETSDEVDLPVDLSNKTNLTSGTTTGTSANEINSYDQRTIAATNSAGGTNSNEYMASVTDALTKSLEKCAAMVREDLCMKALPKVLAEREGGAPIPGLEAPAQQEPQMDPMMLMMMMQGMNNDQGPQAVLPMFESDVNEPSDDQQKPKADNNN